MVQNPSPPSDLDRYFDESAEIWRLRLGVPNWLKDSWDARPHRDRERDASTSQ